MGQAEFFLEVRCEEIPAQMLRPAVHQLGSRLFEELMASHLAPTEVTTSFTPRRLVVTLRGLPEREPDRRERQTGPPASVAFDDDGKPTKALLGFAQRCGVEPDRIEVETTAKGDYVVASVEIAGRKTTEVLAETTPRILKSLPWPKSMRWGSSIGPWVRPVHSIVALFDGEIVDFELFGVWSGDRTIGHPIHSPQEIRVVDSESYHSALGELGILVSFETRQETLLEGLEEAARQVGGRPVPDAELLDKLTSICEIPGVVCGQIEAMDLPREVLVASLRDHQSAFTVESEEGLLPFFLTVMDRSTDPEGRVRRGNEWVVAARLDDARFFYAEDRKKSLASRREDLARITFHEHLGNYALKSERLVELTSWLASELGWQEHSAGAIEAAALLKADLATEMVKEFTSLQGVVGGVYAREEGASDDVWEAIYDQYLPASTDDRIPRGPVGQLVSLADRVDTLVGLFGCGLVPTGSRDPFGLRRVAQGLARILLDGDLRIDFEAVARRSIELYGERLSLGDAGLLEALRPFLLDRLRHLLGLEGFAYDEIEAALATGGSVLPDLRDRVAALHEVRNRQSFRDVVLAAKRIENILKGVEPQELRPEGLKEPAEVALGEAARTLDAELAQSEESRDYARALERIADFAGVLDRFFVEVLVMADDPVLRSNRLALLQSIRRTLSRTAGLTEMVVDKGESESNT